MLSILMLLISTSFAQVIPNSVQLGNETPDVYTIQVGDTLWDISQKFLGNPYNWPRLWSINEYITNPHWIYPGNRIVFVPGTILDPPGMSLETGEYNHDGFVTRDVIFEEGIMECGLIQRFDYNVASTVYRAPGYLEDGRKLETLGSVYKAQTGHEYLGERQIVYLDLDDANFAECGDIVSIVRKEQKKVKHPEGGMKFGSMFRIVAEARILHLRDNIAMASIRQSYFEVQRGDVVTTRVPVSVEMEVDKPKGSLEGYIVARLGTSESTIAAVQETVFLDRGKADGVRVGNSFWVIEQRDELIDMDKEDTKLPPNIIGRLVVVRVGENSSTAVVVNAANYIEVGQRVTMRLE